MHRTFGNRRSGLAAVAAATVTAGAMLVAAPAANAAQPAGPDPASAGAVAVAPRLELPPGKPENLTMKRAGHAIRFHWSPPSSGASEVVGYRILIEPYKVIKGKKKLGKPITAVIKKTSYRFNNAGKGRYEVLVLAKTAHGYGLPAVANFRIGK